MQKFCEHRLSTQISAKCAKSVHAMRIYSATELPFSTPPLLVGKKGEEANIGRPPSWRSCNGGAIYPNVGPYFNQPLTCVLPTKITEGWWQKQGTLFVLEEEEEEEGEGEEEVLVFSLFFLQRVGMTQSFRN